MRKPARGRSFQSDGVIHRARRCAPGPDHSVSPSNFPGPPAPRRRRPSHPPLPFALLGSPPAPAHLQRLPPVLPFLRYARQLAQATREWAPSDGGARRPPRLANVAGLAVSKFNAISIEHAAGAPTGWAGTWAGASRLAARDLRADGVAPMAHSDRRRPPACGLRTGAAAAAFCCRPRLRSLRADSIDLLCVPCEWLWWARA